MQEPRPAALSKINEREKGNARQGSGAKPTRDKKIKERASARSLARALGFPGSTTGRPTTGITRVRVTRDGRRIAPVPGAQVQFWSEKKKKKIQFFFALNLLSVLV
jgi:hypothetical protein